MVRLGTHQAHWDWRTNGVKTWFGVFRPSTSAEKNRTFGGRVREHPLAENLKKGIEGWNSKRIAKNVKYCKNAPQMSTLTVILGSL